MAHLLDARQQIASSCATWELALDGLVVMPQAPAKEHRQTGEEVNPKWYGATINGYLPKCIGVVAAVNLTAQVTYVLQDLGREILCAKRSLVNLVAAVRRRQCLPIIGWLA